MVEGERFKKSSLQQGGWLQDSSPLPILVIRALGESPGGGSDLLRYTTRFVPHSFGYDLLRVISDFSPTSANLPEYVDQYSKWVQGRVVGGIPLDVQKKPSGPNSIVLIGRVYESALILPPKVAAIVQNLFLGRTVVDTALRMGVSEGWIHSATADARSVFNKVAAACGYLNSGRRMNVINKATEIGRMSSVRVLGRKYFTKEDAVMYLLSRKTVSLDKAISDAIAFEAVFNEAAAEFRFTRIQRINNPVFINGEPISNMTDSRREYFSAFPDLPLVHRELNAALESLIPNPRFREVFAERLNGVTTKDLAEKYVFTEKWIKKILSTVRPAILQWLRDNFQFQLIEEFGSRERHAVRRGKIRYVEFAGLTFVRQQDVDYYLANQAVVPEVVNLDEFTPANQSIGKNASKTFRQHPDYASDFVVYGKRVYVRKTVVPQIFAKKGRGVNKDKDFV